MDETGGLFKVISDQLPGHCSDISPRDRLKAMCEGRCASMQVSHNASMDGLAVSFIVAVVLMVFGSRACGGCGLRGRTGLGG
jgi:hypothetical protein